MEVIVRHCYTDGTEIKEGDVVYLQGHDSNRNEYFGGICKVDGLSGQLFTAYFLGQQAGSMFDIEMYIRDIDKLIKLNNGDIDRAIEKEMLKV